MDAKTVLSRYWDGNLPVNVEQIALLMGINVQLSDDLITASGEIEAELQREARKDMVSLRNLRAYISRLPKVFKLFMFLWSHKKI